MYVLYIFMHDDSILSNLAIFTNDHSCLLNLGLMVFLFSFPSPSIFLYWSSETSRDSSNTPAGMTKGLCNQDIVLVACAVRLGSSILLLDLTGVAKCEDVFVGIFLGDLDFVDGDLIHKCRDDFPSDWNCHRGVDDPQLEQPASIVPRHLLDHGFENIARNFCDSHIVQIVDNTPAFNLAGQEHRIDNLLMSEDHGFEAFLKILHVDPLGVENENRSKIFVSSAGIEHASILGLTKKIRWGPRLANRVLFHYWGPGILLWIFRDPALLDRHSSQRSHCPRETVEPFARWIIPGLSQACPQSRIYRTLLTFFFRTHHARSDRSRKIWCHSYRTKFSAPSLSKTKATRREKSISFFIDANGHELVVGVHWLVSFQGNINIISYIDLISVVI